MRTTIELPDPLYRQVKAKAALEGVPMKALVQRLVERGLDMPDEAAPARKRSALPSISVGNPLPVVAPSNAGLFELMEEGE
jgi:hypothetical protein